MDEEICILIFSNNSKTISVLGNALTQEGWLVLLLSKYDEVIKTIKAYKPNMMIFDNTMPGLDGIEFCRDIISGLSVPLFIISSINNKEEKIDYLNLGADE